MIDEDVARLVAEERISAAATLASSRGDAHTASELFERACEWRRAAEEALHANEPARALRLAVVARDAGIANDALAKVDTDAAAAARTADVLDRQGDSAWAARVYEKLGKRADAARAWERAGDATQAARLLEGSGDVVGAARVLEAAIRRSPSAWDDRVALGALLLRYGKTDAAVRTLQAVPADAPQRRGAVALLAKGLERLGLVQAALEAGRELDALGGPPESVKVAAATPDPDAAARPKTRIYGRYDVVRTVASTASARVLECIDTVRGEHVAVKVFAGYQATGGGRDVLARFEREVKVLASLDHPNVVPLRDYFPDGPALVLAWMPGGTLAEMLAAGPVAPARAVEIACAVLAALGEAHRVGVLHRDVKPANVLFDAAGTARLADFGVAHLGDLSATATAGVIGTFAYMAPEQREGKAATIQTDVYGVGAILFEMLTGDRPAADGTVPSVRPSGVHRDLDARHDAVVLSLVAPETHARPSDAFAARRALTSLSWPRDIELAAPRVARPAGARAPSDRPSTARVRREASGREVDEWTGRAITRVPLDDATLARAGAFARAGAVHPVLQTVLRVDRAAEEIWLEAPRGAPLDRPLTPREAGALRDAIEALHTSGAVHGSVDAAHVRVAGEGELTLLFAPRADATATIDVDRLQLARLGSQPA